MNEKVKDQIKFLEPINQHAIKIQELNDKLATLNHSKETAVFWFAQKGLNLAEIELQKTEAQFNQLQLDLNQLKEKEISLKNLETNLTVQIKSDDVGQQIEQIKIDLAQLEKAKLLIEEKQATYNQYITILGFTTNPTSTIFDENSAKIQDLKTENQINSNRLQEQLRGLKNNADQLKEEIAQTQQFNKLTSHAGD